MALTKVTTHVLADDIALGGNPTTTTQSAGNNTTRIATTAFVTGAVSDLVDGAPSTLNTLNEIAAALNDDAALNTTLTNSIATKLPLAGGTLTGDITLTNDKDIHFLTNSGSNDGTMITRASGDALRIKYATNVLIFDAVDNLATRFYNSNGVSALEILPNATAADSQVKVNNGNFIVNSGNVGIGAASPAALLHVNLTGDGDAVKIQGNGATDFDFVGNPPEFNLEDTSSSTNTKRARLTIDDNAVAIQGLSDDDATLNHTFLSGNLSSGNLTLSDYVQLGSIGSSTSSATPIELNLGSTFANAAGSAAKAKLKIFEDTSGDVYGLGVSSGTFENHLSFASGKYDWYIGTNRKMRLGHDGILDLKTNNTGAVVVPNGTTAQQPTAATGMIRYNTTNTKLEAYIGSAWENVTTTSQSITGITGLDVWADVTGGISSTTIADLSGNSRTGTLSNTSHSGTLSGNTYMHFNGTSEYLSYGDATNFPDYSGDVTFFFVLTNTTGFSTYRTLIGDSSGATGYNILRTNGSTDDWNFYNRNHQGKVLTSTNTALNSNSSINTTQILIFSFGAQSGGNLTIYKRTGGSETSDVFTGEFNTNAVWAFNANTSSTFYIGNSSWAGEHYDGGIFAWGIIDHEITSSEKQVIYDYYAAKSIGN